MANTLLEVRDLHKQFGGVVATNQVSLSVHEGEIHALIGPNGAGKTTLISQLSGLLKSDGGTVHFRNRNITDRPMHALAKMGLARSFQITSVFPEMTVLENASLAVQAASGHSFHFWTPAIKQNKLREQAEFAIARVGLEARAQYPAQHLSHGERRQLEIAMALCGNPSLLLLDEPMAGMGSEESAELLALLRSLKGEKTILLVEHDMDAVFALADRISVLVYGSVIATGTPAEIRSNSEVREAYLGEPDDTTGEHA